MANSIDPDETPHSVASHLGLNCLLRPVCPNTYGKYGTYASEAEVPGNSRQNMSALPLIPPMYSEEMPRHDGIIAGLGP